MEFFLQSKISFQKIKDNVARVEVEPLFPGYGYTIGNALRRVLLSSLSGAAITQVKIEGVSHEFSTIDGVMEDVILILQNLKKLRFKMIGDETQTITLKAKGEMEVKGKHFVLPSQLELVNGETHIATLTSKNAQIVMEAKVEKGIGYLSLEERQNEEAPIGTIFVDAIFSPIRRVSLDVENVRVGKRTDFDKLILEIETDGTISPQEAFLKSCQILFDHYQHFLEELKHHEEKKVE